METLKMHSLDGVQRNIELIGKLFPNAITEVKRDGKVEHAIDFDVLRQELSDSIVEGREERYQFTWPDKKKAMLAQCAHYGNPAPGCGRQRWQGWHTRRF